MSEQTNHQVGDAPPQHPPISDQHHTDQPINRPTPPRSWIPTDRPKPRAVVFLSHGVNEHIGRYGELAHALTKEGYAGGCAVWVGGLCGWIG